MRFNIAADMTYQFAQPSEVLLLIEAASTADQAVLSEDLVISTSSPVSAAVTRQADPETGELRTLFLAQDQVRITYQAQVEVAAREVSLAGLAGTAVEEMPADALRYLRPSRYCPSDRFERYVSREFADTKGGDRVEAILAWIDRHLDYVSGLSDASTTALDTFVDRAGVCRDFTHLAISLCRASQVPARAVSAYGYLLEPPDMHAVMEVYIGGEWRLVDPTRKVMADGLVRVATGHDAADIAFMSIFGQAMLVDQSFSIEQVDG